ncbi:hypothetical protein B878_05002 [Vibrio campbellii CAIM 519 = NBRC 15631 = ATCC 25920]|nr:hypothetical protein [Vibrio campbellii]ELU52946.1 hypothetical protein B878_05002 [Vibrio campbellii CAIM 519 = NBRC 15631 = ATCC 25920]
MSQRILGESKSRNPLYEKNTMKILFAIAPLFLSMSVEASVYFGPPDGENIIDIESKDGYLFKVENGIYVQAHSEEFVLGIATLFENLKQTRTGRAIINQNSHYAPLALPNKERALAFHTEGQVDGTIEKIHVVIRPPRGGKQFVTEPLIASPEFVNYQSNGLGVPAVIYFDIDNAVLIPGSSTIIEPSIALGHELIHARDYLTGGLPTGTQRIRHHAPVAGTTHNGEEFTEGEVVEFSLMTREIEATGLSYQKGSTKLKTLTTSRQSSIERRESVMNVWEEALKNKSVSKADYARVKTNIQRLKSEVPVSEYHLSKEFGNEARDMYWPGSMIDYSSTPTDITLKSVKQTTSGVLSSTALSTTKVSEALHNSPQSLLLISTSLIERKNGFPKLDKVLRTALELAIKADRKVILLEGDNFSSLTEVEKRLTVATIEKAADSIKKGNTSSSVIQINADQISNEGRDLLAQSEQVVLISTNDDISALAMSESIAGSSQKLLVNRIVRSDQPNPSVIYANRLRWSKLAERENVTLVANSTLPKSKKCWSL